MAEYKIDWDRLADMAYPDPMNRNEEYDPDYYDNEFDFLIDYDRFDEAYEYAFDEGKDFIVRKIVKAMKFIENDSDFSTKEEAVEFIKRVMRMSFATEQRIKQDMIDEKKVGITQ